MARIWSEEAKLARWLDVELAALEAWAELGVVPRSPVDAIARGAVAPTPARVAELEAKTQHDVAAFVDAVAEQLGDEGRYFHYGLTSSDVLDTALSLQVREAGELVLAGLDRARMRLAQGPFEHRAALLLVRAHAPLAAKRTVGVVEEVSGGHIHRHVAMEGKDTRHHGALLPVG